MKNNFKKAILSFAAFLFSTLILNPVYSAAESLDLRADLWCPYTCDVESIEPGYLVEIAKAILQKKGMSVKYSTQSWARTLNEARTGKIDGALGAGKSDEGLLFPSHHLGRSKNCFFAKNDSTFQFKDNKDLVGKKIGAIIEYTYSEPFDSFAKDNPNIERSGGETPVETNIKKLLAGRLELMIEDENVVNYYLKKNPNPIKSVGCYEPTDIFVVFSPKKTESLQRVKAFNEGYKALKDSGELKLILTKYGIKEWQD